MLLRAKGPNIGKILITVVIIVDLSRQTHELFWAGVIGLHFRLPETSAKKGCRIRQPFSSIV